MVADDMAQRVAEVARGAKPGEQPSLDELLARFDPSALPREPTVLGA